MSILTGGEIVEQARAGRILIDPFDESRAGPNSYDLTLSPELLVYNVPGVGLDMRSKPETARLTVPEDGLVLQPGRLYLGATAERCGSGHYVCCIEGRSSVGRLGVGVHVTAGFGDLGFDGRWTLEITVIHPVRVYAGVRVCQAYFFTPSDDAAGRYSGKYAGQTGPAPSRLWQDFLADDGGSD